MDSDWTTVLVLRSSKWLRLWLWLALTSGCATCVAILAGLIPAWDTVITGVMAIGLFVTLPGAAREIWRFHVWPVVSVEGDVIHIYARGRSRQMRCSELAFAGLDREILNDYLTLQSDSGEVHRMPVQIDGSEHRQMVEAWAERIQERRL